MSQKTANPPILPNTPSRIIVRAYVPEIDNHATVRYPTNLDRYYALDIEEEVTIWRGKTPHILTIGTRIVRHISKLEIQPAIRRPAGA
jgi:hypothetical protein